MTTPHIIRGAFIQRRTRGAVVALVACALFTACGSQRIRDDSLARQRAGEYEQAIASLEDGLRRHPEDAVLRASLLEARADAVARLIAESAAARATGQFDGAAKSLKRALSLQPGNARIEALLSGLAVEERQRAALAEAESLGSRGEPDQALQVIAEALKANPRHADLVALQRRLELLRRQGQLKAAQLGLAEHRPISLDFRDAPLRTVLDLVSRNSGVNFVFDKDVRADARISVFLESVKVEDALDLITSTHQLSKKVLDSRTVLIYPSTPEKHREHQEQLVRVFYLASADAKGAASFLRTMLRLRETFVDERTNMVAIREAQPTVMLAERLIALYDTAEPEVLLEVEVMEVRSSRLTELGVKLPDTFALTLLPPSGQGGLTLENVAGAGRDRIALALGGVTINLRREAGDFNTLANPRIRVRSKEKAKILVGDKVPVVSAVTGPNNFVTESVSYLEVGLKVDVEPTVSIDDEIAIRVALEVSSLGNAIRTSTGTIAYQIGTRNASTLLRLRDGETQLLAGLISTEDRTNASRLPGLGDLPVLGRLFSSTRDDNARSEIVLSITPRILRNIRRPEISEAELWVGTDAQPRLQPVGGVRSAPAEVAARSAGTGDATARAPTAAARPSSASASAPPLDGPVASPRVAALQWLAPAEVKAGDSFAVALTVRTADAIRGAPLRLSYSSERVELLSVQEGDFFRQGGEATAFTSAVDASRGGITAGVLRKQASGAVGQGSVLTLRFKAKAPGVAELRVDGIDPVGAAGPVGPPEHLPLARIQVHSQ